MRHIKNDTVKMWRWKILVIFDDRLIIMLDVDSLDCLDTEPFIDPVLQVKHEDFFVQPEDIEPVDPLDILKKFLSMIPLGSSLKFKKEGPSFAFSVPSPPVYYDIIIFINSAHFWKTTTTVNNFPLMKYYPCLENYSEFFRIYNYTNYSIKFLIKKFIELYHT